MAMLQAHNNDRRMEQRLPPEEKETSDQKTWVWPDLVYIELLCMILCTVALVVWSITVRAPLEEPANPANTPNPSKAPWYFLGLQELLVYFDPWFAGVVLPSIIVLGLMAIPYIDVNPKGSGYYCFKERRLAILTFLIGFFVMWDFLIPIGTILRGPGWNVFGPFEEWSSHKVVALTNVNLSEYVWVKAFYPLGQAIGWEWLAQGLPATDGSLSLANITRVFKKEFAGILILAFYFCVLPGLLARGWLKDFCERLGFARYSVAIFLFLTMATVPMKMYLRWLVNLKYIVDTPWIKF
ncbi:MAG: cytochrome C [Verrucomicrobia bacterium]|nr:cytochrome C [Verrucomicrobiota bacterium]